MRPIAAISLLLTIGGLSQADGVIEMQRYTVDSPDGQGWQVVQHPEQDVAELRHAQGSPPTGRTTMIYIVPHDTTRAYGGKHSERWLADDVRRQEESSMIALGVEPGLYDLQDVKKTDIEIAGKACYAMTYTQVLDGMIAKGYAVIYFPPDFAASGILYKFVGSQMGRKRDMKNVDWEAFEAVIASFRLRLGSGENEQS